VTLLGGILGCLLAVLLIAGIKQVPGMGFFFLGMKVTWSTYVLAILISGIVGLVSAIVPSYHAAKISIVEGLRHIG
jgi:ABC-type antimicrobial peptide transport system permease subunit